MEEGQAEGGAVDANGTEKRHKKEKDKKKKKKKSKKKKKKKKKKKGEKGARNAKETAAVPGTQQATPTADLFGPSEGLQGDENTAAEVTPTLDLKDLFGSSSDEDWLR